MCLGVPGKVMEVDGRVAIVDFWGVRKQVRLELLDRPVQRGDYILDHFGYAIHRVPSKDVEATLVLFEELLKQVERDNEPREADIGGETDDVAATPT